ncbi:MAG: addiction module protein [Pyrinomonadaceae bacterium]
MATIHEVETLAFALSESDRAVLAAHLLDSLPGILIDEDEGIAEALRRDAELDLNPEIGLSLEEFDRRIKSRK